MTGAELRALRKAAVLSQAELARRVAIGRHSVSYWECREDVNLNGWAVRRMLSALGAVHLTEFPAQYARARTWGLMQDAERARFDALVEARAVERRMREARRAAGLRVPCGAKTRKGTACRDKSEPGKRRCKFHGGLSTGPRTPEGRARIAEAQRRRWAAAAPV